MIKFWIIACWINRYLLPPLLITNIPTYVYVLCVGSIACLDKDNSYITLRFQFHGDDTLNTNLLTVWTFGTELFLSGGSRKAWHYRCYKYCLSSALSYKTKRTQK